MYNRCAQRHFKLSELAVQNGGLCSVTTGIGKRLPQIPQLRGSKGASSPTRFCSTTIQTIGVAVQNGQMWCPKCLTVMLNDTPKYRSAGCPKWVWCSAVRLGRAVQNVRGWVSRMCVKLKGTVLSDYLPQLRDRSGYENCKRLCSTAL